MHERRKPSGDHDPSINVAKDIVGVRLLLTSVGREIVYSNSIKGQTKDLEKYRPISLPSVN